MFKVYTYFTVLEKYKKAKTYGDYNKLLEDLEKCIDFDKTTSFPIFMISYPSNIEKCEMKSSHILKLDLNETEMQQLIDNGFSLLDKNILDNKREFIENPFEFLYGDESYILVDTRYGVLIGNMNGQIINMSLDTLNINKYLKKYSFLTSRTDYLSIGANIANLIKFGSCSDRIISYTVKSRREFDEVIDEWNDLLKNKSEFSLWYRGQIDEYTIPCLPELSKKICPWRNVTDVSLTPSIYREGKDIKKYVEYMLEMLLLQDQFTKPFMNLIQTVRDGDEICKEKIPEQLKLLEYTIIRRNDNEVFSVTDTHMQYFSYIELLLQQHYGIESPLLDITKDPDIALFFAQNEVEEKKYTKIEYSKHKPVVYIFILNNELDPIIDSEILMKEFCALRPVRQKCGIMSGATQVKKDFYSKFVAIRIILEDYIEYDKKYSQEYLFPSREEDEVLDLIMQIKEKYKFKNITPFYVGDKVV